MTVTTDPTSDHLASVAATAGLHRVHILAWRDLADPEAGGSEVHASEVASRWAAAGIDVVMRTSHAVAKPAVEERDGYRVLRRGGRHAVFVDAPVRELMRRAGRADGLVEVWNGVPFFTPLWARLPRVTFVHHVHEDMWEQSLSPRLARLGRAIETRIAPRLYQRARILTPSPSSKREIVDRLGLPAANITTVPNGVHRRYTPGGQRADHPVVLTVGRLVPHKRVHLLVDAVARIRSEIPDIELIIAGDGYLRDELARYVEERRAAGYIRFTGRIDDDELLEHYRRAWVVASASMVEGWGLTLSEAAATGTAVVATHIAGHQDVVAHERSGLLVEPAELADALRYVLSDPVRRARLESGALERGASFSWDATALGILTALADEAGRSRAG